MTAGLVGPALRWTVAAGAVTGIGWVALVATDFSLMIADQEIPRALHALVLVVLSTMIVCVLMIHLAARLIRGQRKLAAVIAASSATPVCGYPEGYADGLAGRPAKPQLTVVQS